MSFIVLYWSVLLLQYNFRVFSSVAKTKDIEIMKPYQLMDITRTHNYESFVIVYH